MAATQGTNYIELPSLKLGNNPCANFTTFKLKFADYVIMTNLTEKKTKTQQAATLRTCFGQEETNMYLALDLVRPADKEDIGIIMTLMEEYIIGDLNVTYERFVFHKRMQKKNESVTEFITALKELAGRCDYKDLLDENVKD